MQKGIIADLLYSPLHEDVRGVALCIVAALVAATALAGYIYYRSGQSEDDKGKNKVPMAEHNIKMAKYYGGEEEFKWFSLVNRADYTSCGHYTDERDETDPESGRKYKRGHSVDHDAPYVLRDEKQWKLIVDNMPKDRQIKVCELGSGRGATARIFAKKLLDMGKLKKMVCANISEFENEYNME